jgi:hypothetical protein
MKYICLGYLEPGKFEGMTEDERNATFDECFECNDHLRANGHLVAEIRPVTDLSKIIKDSEQRRRRKSSSR